MPRNEFLITVPQPRRASESRPLLTTTLFDLHLHDRGSVGFPAHVLPEPASVNLFTDADSHPRMPRANLAASVWEKLQAEWGLTGDRDGQAAIELVQSLFRLTLAVCHSPQYEADHRESLAQDWAHVPVPKEKALLDQVAALGEQVTVLLDPAANVSPFIAALLGSDARTLGVARSTGGTLRPSDLVVSYSYYGAAAGRYVPRDPIPPETQRPCWGSLTADLYLNETVYLAHVPERVWRYELGGYPVIKKWLGYRDGRRRPGTPLSIAEADHLRSMVQRIAALLVLQERLDTAYEEAMQNAFTAEELGL